MYIIYILEILIQSVTVDHSEEKKSEFSKSPGGELPYETDGDARRKF